MGMANKTSSIQMATTSLEKSSEPDTCVEEKKVKSNGDLHEGVVLVGVKDQERDHVQEENDRKRPSYSIAQDLSSLKHEEQLRSAKAEINEAKEENERLKQLLSKMAKDYQSLHELFLKTAQKEDAKKSMKTTPFHNEENQESQLVSLSLGRSSSDEPKKEEPKKSNTSDGNEDDETLSDDDKGLSLGLDFRKFDPDFSVTINNNNPSSEESSFDEEPREEEPNKIWPPSKVLKTTTLSADDQVQMKKARVSVRARCDTPTMNDGCQWRKYGQKIAKGNPCPRAYYRCTVSPTCPVRKQVQRCAEDMSILITTYEGTHNHPLPLSATAMASATSAALSMLQSRSSTSSRPVQGTSSSLSAPASISNTNTGLNFTLSSSQNNAIRPQVHFPNSSISTSQSHPTITLDLTAPTTNTSSHHFKNRFSFAPRFSSPTCLNFSSSSSSYTSSWSSLWNPDYSTYRTLHHSRKQQPPHQDHIPHMQVSNQQNLTETIAAATKVIALDPTFRSVLAAAITSFVGNGGGENIEINPGVGEHYSGLNLKLGDHDESLTYNRFYNSSSQSGIGCASSYLNNKSQQQGSLVSFPPSFPFSSSKGASRSPANNRDHA